jgi:hypothetical protein
MAVANTNALELLGKEVSFQYDRKVEITNTSFITYSEMLTGTITNLVLSLNSEPEISIDDANFYLLSELTNFQLLH